MARSADEQVDPIPEGRLPRDFEEFTGDLDKVHKDLSRGLTFDPRSFQGFRVEQENAHIHQTIAKRLESEVSIKRCGTARICPTQGEAMGENHNSQRPSFSASPENAPRPARGELVFQRTSVIRHSSTN